MGKKVKAKRNETRNAILGLLAHTPMTERQLATALGRTCLSDSIHRMRKVGLIYIRKWKRSYTTGGRPGAIYAVGSRPDAQEPKNDRKADGRRYYDKNVRRKKYANVRAGGADAKGRAGSRVVNPWLQLLGENT